MKKERKDICIYVVLVICTTSRGKEKKRKKKKIYNDSHYNTDKNLHRFFLKTINLILEISLNSCRTNYLRRVKNIFSFPFYSMMSALLEGISNQRISCLQLQVDHRWLCRMPLLSRCLSIRGWFFFEKIRFFIKVKTGVYSIKNHYQKCFRV
jgi:hypothetical protein